jgi:hypothetical protein
VVVAQRHGSGFLIGGLIVPRALAPCTYLHIASGDADAASEKRSFVQRPDRTSAALWTWVFGGKRQYNIGDRLAVSCVLPSDVALRLGSCNPSAVLALLGCDGVAGCRTRLWVVWLSACVSGRSGC